MGDIWTVFRKELLEVLGDRSSFRGVFLQALITVMITGMVVPALERKIWTEVPTAMMLYVLFPSTLAATMAADAFAGESERLTLEGLLATPLSELSIYIGKLAVAVLLVMVISSASLLAGIVTAAVRGFLPWPLPLPLFAGLLCGALAGAVLTAAIAVSISVRLLAARSAQQMSSLITFAIAGLIVALLKRLSVLLTWNIILRADVVVLSAGLIIAFWGTKLFRRDRFF